MLKLFFTGSSGRGHQALEHSQDVVAFLQDVGRATTGRNKFHAGVDASGEVNNSTSFLGPLLNAALRKQNKQKH